MSKAPCKGSSNCLLFFYSCPYRALAVCVRLPRAMPWAMETLGFQPVFAQTLLFTSLQFYVAYLSQLLIFPSLFHSFSFLLNCFFVPIFVMPFVRDAFGMIVGFLSLLSSLIFSSLLLAARPNVATSPQPRASPWV